MRKLIYLMYHNGTVHAAFTRHMTFHVERWAAKNNTMLRTIGVKKVGFWEVNDSFRLPWEKA